MRKPIVFVNLALLLLVAWMVAGARSSWRANHARYARLTGPPAAALRFSRPAAGGLSPGIIPATASYADFVNRNLFAPDRNNEQPVIKVEKKQRPPVPYVIGTFNLGGGMVALMADEKQASQGRFRRVKAGEEVGGYTVVEIADHKVTIEFDGEKTAIDVYESAANVPGGGPAAYAPAPAASAPQVQTAVSAGVTAPGAATQAQPANVPANLDPQGAASFRTEGNEKVYYRATPFGVATWKQPVAPAAKPQ